MQKTKRLGLDDMQDAILSCHSRLLVLSFLREEENALSDVRISLFECNTRNAIHRLINVRGAIADAISYVCDRVQKDIAPAKPSNVRTLIDNKEINSVRAAA
jgi:hypothetical protein